MKTLILGLTALFVASGCAGCTDDAVVPSDDPIVIDEKPAPPPNEEPEPEPEPEFAYVLESVESLPLEALTLQTREVSVRLRDSADGTPVPGEELDFVLTTAPDADTSLLQDVAVTAETGTTSVQLQLGTEIGPAVVMVRHPDAEPLYVRLDVVAPTEGWISVDIREPAQPPITLNPYRIRAYDAAEVTCATFRPRQRAPQERGEFWGPDASQPVLGEGFTGDVTYTVVAEAMGNGARTLGWGCADSIVVVPGEITETFVNIEILPINPSGRYAVDGLWDISEAVAAASSGSNTFVTVIEFMANPGQSIYDLVINEIESALGFPVGILLGYTGVQQQIVDYINGQLFQFAPLATFSAVANDLKTLLHEMQVESLLVIDKADADLHFFGHEEWHKIHVNWTWPCQNNPGPTCGQHEIDLAGLDAGAATVRYDWEGYVQNYDELIIQSHTATIDVGKLQVYLLEKAIIPELTGGAASTMGGALAHWVNCRDLAANALNGNDICDPTGIFCIGQTFIEGACVAAMNEIGDYITDPLQNQPSVSLDLTGDARLIDGGAISFADEVVEANTTGTVQGGTEAVSAGWSAARIVD